MVTILRLTPGPENHQPDQDAKLLNRRLSLDWGATVQTVQADDGPHYQVHIPHDCVGFVTGIVLNHGWNFDQLPAET